MPRKALRVLRWLWYVNCVSQTRGSNSTAGTGAHLRKGIGAFSEPRHPCDTATPSIVGALPMRSGQQN